MGRRPFRISGDGPPLIDIVSYGRAGPQQHWRTFSPAEVHQIARTVRRIPEVMVKVTGGGKSVGAVGAHFAYLSRRDELEIETDEGERVANRDEQKALLKSWHLELSAGQYRRPREAQPAARRLKLTHHIVLSMPAPTPPKKVLAAARNFAREKFGAQHRYAMVLHTDQKHPHVHLVVKAESEHGKRMHIDKLMLREWRETFARLMREQGVAANATSGQTGTVRDPAREQLLARRKVVAGSWMKAAEVLDAQGETTLAGEVRQFVRHLPRVLTDKERLAEQFMRHLEAQKAARATREHPRDRADEQTR